MREYVTDALVIAREPFREADLRVTFFTENFGKLSAKVKSGRNIVSKLGPHLEPLNFARIRLIEKNGFLVADALRIKQFSKERMPVLSLISAILPETDPDPELWSLLYGGEANSNSVLSLLGFDPEFAACVSCNAPKPGWFSTIDLEYRCASCVGRFRRPSFHEVRAVS